MAGWIVAIIAIACLLVGGLSGFLLTKHFFQKQLEKNPPINANMIRAMYQKMGRKPSEAQINAVMEAMKRQQKGPGKK